MSVLFSPIEIGSNTLVNRIIVSPMCQYSAKDGNAGSWHAAHLGSLAMGGAALLFTEATAVSPEGRITPGDLGLYSDANQVALEQVFQALRHNSDIVLGVQLSHAGRKASSRAPWDGGALLAAADGGWATFAPSALPHAQGESAPVAMTATDMERVRDDFVAAAKRAAVLGVEVIELHVAHGYLLHQFVSPVSNQRTDDYGGSLENRIRFPLEVLAAVRAALAPEIAVGIRISATDWLEHLPTPSLTLAETITLALRAEATGAAFIDVSSGGISPLQKIRVGPSYQVPFAAAVKARLKIPVFAVGMITEPAQAEAIVANGDADCVALARAMLYDPRWAWRAARELGGTVQGPKQYWRSLPSGSGRIFGDIKVGQR